MTQPNPAGPGRPRPERYLAAAQPELPAQAGWMQGAAGIGAARLRGHQVLTGSQASPWLPSWPFGGPPGRD